MQKIDKKIITSIKTDVEFDVSPLLNTEEINCRMTKSLEENEKKVQLGRRKADRIFVDGLMETKNEPGIEKVKKYNIK